MANFSQLRRRQSSREILYRTQFSNEFEDIHMHHLEHDEEQPRRRHNSAHNRAAVLQKLMSPEASHLTWHANPDELGEIMWQMRPRFATSAGEMKRRQKRERLLTLEKERRESLRKKAKTTSIEEEKEEEAVLEAEEAKDTVGTLKPSASATNKLLKAVRDQASDLPPSRVSSVSQFTEPPPEGDNEGGHAKEVWDSKITFILATIGYAVGLGNVWRFPYLAQKNGGGAFIIPYAFMLLAEGLPIFLLELAIGQRLRKGSIGVWKQISPYLGGIGIASGVVSFNVALYYNTIIAWCLFYFGSSFMYPLPWSYCPEESVPNSTEVRLVEECVASSPTQYFWYRQTLNISENIEQVDSFNWWIFLTLIIAWVLIYCCLVKGITENPKIIWVTAIYPYIVLIIFFVRAMTLEGMEDGVAHLFSPKWDRLLDPVVWLEAGTQIFFSLGLAFGGLIAYSSYNPVNNDCTRDAVIVAITNCGTSLFAGIVIFAIMGFKANRVHKECLISQNATLIELFGTSALEVPEDGIMPWRGPDGIVVNKTLPVCDLQKELDESASGTGLAFILFTEAVNQFPGGNFWAILFFLMLFTLGLDSQFGTVQGVIQCVIDLKFMPNVPKPAVTGAICGTCLLLSMVFAHGGGNYIFTLYDNFSGTVPLLVIALSECLAVSYIYGLKRFSDDIELMTGRRPSYYWLFCWKYLAPLAMTIILVASVIEMSLTGAGYEAWSRKDAHKTMEEWPGWCHVIIFILIGMSAFWIPGVAILRSFGITVLKPEKVGWFPADDLKEYYGLEEHKITKAEHYVFGFREDGSEGICCPTHHELHALPEDKPPTIFTNPPDEELIVE